MGNNRKTAVTVIVMIGAVCIALLLALTIYAYSTPKVYCAPLQQGLVNGQIFDTVIPKDALFDGNTIYIVTPIETVLGTRYRVYAETVEVIAEGEGMVALSLFGSMNERYFVLAHDGRLQKSGEVLMYRS